MLHIVQVDKCYGLYYWAVTLESGSATALHRSGGSSEKRCPGAAPLLTHFGTISRVNFFLIFCNETYNLPVDTFVLFIAISPEVLLPVTVIL